MTVVCNLSNGHTVFSVTIIHNPQNASKLVVNHSCHWSGWFFRALLGCQVFGFTGTLLKATLPR